MPQLITPDNLRGGARQPAPIQIVDVGRDPGLKSALLSGRLTNLAAPFIYHDPSKQIAYVLMPMELNLRDNDQQRIIGQLTQQVMRGLPEDAPRAYLLQPKMYITLQSLIEAILEQDGVTPEVLRAQQEKVELLRELARSTDEAGLRAKARENDARIDAAFFDILSASIEANLNAGREQAANQLGGLQQILIQETTYGKKVGARVALLEAFQKSPTREVLLEQLVGAPDTESREMLIALGRQLLDYAFFQQLTQKIEAASPEEKDRLIALRKEIQDTRDKVDEASRAFMQEKVALIQAIASSKDPLQTAQEREAEIDDAFFSVLQANAQEAQRRGDEQTLKALSAVNEIAMQIMAERQPPEVQMINALLSANYPEETGKMLEELKDIADDRLIGVMAQFADQLAQQDRTELAAKMTKIMVQARGILPKYDPSKDGNAPPTDDASSQPPPPPEPPKPVIEIARR
jgi:molybdopterin converting factor small subunit